MDFRAEKDERRMSDTSLRRVLCVDLRLQRFGYAVFKGPHTLLDWGVRTFAHGAGTLVRRLAVLHLMYDPSLIIVRKAGRSLHRQSIKVMKAFVSRVSITMQFVDRFALRVFFSTDQKRDKHEVARMVVERFPELAWRLPPKKKLWQAEAVRQSVFDAASLGVFYFAQLANAEKALEKTE